jgi:hypothetical protein
VSANVTAILESTAETETESETATTPAAAAAATYGEEIATAAATWSETPIARLLFVTVSETAAEIGRHYEEEEEGETAIAAFVLGRETGGMLLPRHPTHPTTTTTTTTITGRRNTRIIATVSPECHATTMENTLRATMMHHATKKWTHHHHHHH